MTRKLLNCTYLHDGRSVAIVVSREKCRCVLGTPGEAGMARRPPGGPAQDAPLLICLPPPGIATLAPAPVRINPLSQTRSLYLWLGKIYCFFREWPNFLDDGTPFTFFASQKRLQMFASSLLFAFNAFRVYYAYSTFMEHLQYCIQINLIAMDYIMSYIENIGEFTYLLIP